MSTAPPEPPAPRRRALLVATASYADAGLAGLRAPVGDVQALASVLGDSEIGGFEVSELVDRPTEEVKREIEGFFDDARREDLLLLYFSGHGVLSRSRRFYFATTTTELQWLRATAIDDSFVNEVMQQSRARSIVLMLDCCHSGAFGKGLAPKGPLTVDVEHRFEGRGRVTLSASTELEYAFEETEPATDINAAAPGSLFTRAVVEGLTTGEADLDADGQIAVDELYDYLYQRMRDGPAHQTPGIAGDMRGDIVIARSRRVAEPPPPPLPPVSAPPRSPPPAPARRRRPRTRVIVAAAAGVAAIAAATIVLTGGGGGGGRSGAAGPLAYDFDADGAQEIAIAPLNATSPEMLIHTGSATDRPVVISAAEAGLPDADKTAEFGSGLASADFNHDGHADLAIGAIGFNSVAVLYGTADGLRRHGKPLGGTDSIRFHQYGASLAAGDLDGDGFDDLAVGALGSGDEGSAVQLVFGSKEGLTPAGARWIDAPGKLIFFGERLAIGDVDGRGHPDLVEGSPSDSGGHLTYCPGAAHGPTACRELPRIDGDGGTSALAVADVNHDGRDDIVQANARVGSGSGPVRLWLGEKDGPQGTPQELTPDMVDFKDDDLEAEDAEFGAGVDAGRLDGDDYADIVIGIPGYKHGDGAVAVVPGGKDGFADAGHRVLRRPVGEGHRFGSDVALLRLADHTPTIVAAAEDADLDASVLVADDDDTATPLAGLTARVVRGDAAGLRLGR